MDPATPATDLRRVLFDGRIEKRVTATLPVQLATTKEPRVAERVFTRNVSPHGARVVTNRLWQPGDAGELTFVGLRVVDQQNLLIASNGTEHLVLPITAEQRHHLAQHQRGITLTISSAVTIQAHVQGLER